METPVTHSWLIPENESSALWCIVYEEKTVTFVLILIDINFMEAHLGPEDLGLTIWHREDKKQNSSI